MAKDRTQQALMTALDSGAVTLGASKHLSSYTPLPNNFTIEIQGDDIGGQAQRKCVLIDGLKEPDKTMVIAPIPYVTDKYERVVPTAIYAEVNDQVHEGTDRLEINNVESIQTVEVTYEEAYSKVGLIYLVDRAETPVTGINYAAKNAYIYPFEEPEQIYVDVNFIERPFEITVELPEGYEVEGWYLDAPEPENKIGEENTVTITDKPDVILLNLKQS